MRQCERCDVDAVVTWVNECPAPAKVALVIKAGQARLAELAYLDSVGVGQDTVNVARSYGVEVGRGRARA